MKIKQLKEKTIKGFIDFLPKIGINDIEGLLNELNDKLSKSEGGEVNKPITVTNKDSDYKTIINPDGSIYVLNKNTNNTVFSLMNTDRGVIINNNVYAPIRINRIDALYDKHDNVLYSGNSNVFYANGFVINNGTNKQILLGDGSTTSNLIKQIRINKSNDLYTLTAEDIGNKIYLIEFPGATKELAGLMTAHDKAKLDDIENKTITDIDITQAGGQEGGTLEGVDIYLIYAGSRAGKLIGINNATTTVDGCMSHEDKAKLDDIPNTYLPLSGGKLTGTLRLNDLNSDENGLDINNVNGMQSVDQNKVLTPEVWATNGTSINILNLLSNAAIYVAGGFELVGAINNTTVIDNPDSIVFSRTGRFLAKKDSVYYTHWNADISKNIAPPSRYGIETNEGVFPFNNQIYKFSNQEYIYIAICSNSSCIMKELTLE